MSLDKENTGSYLRVYIDKPEGISLDDCETYHRALQPLVEDYDYDFLEVSSPGADRPLKKDRDFERAIGLEVEVHFFRPVNGAKEMTGTLCAFDKDTFTIVAAGSEVTLERKAASLILPIVDMEGVEEVDLSGPEDTDDQQETAETAPESYGG